MNSAVASFILGLTAAASRSRTTTVVSDVGKFIRRACRAHRAMAHVQLGVAGGRHSRRFEDVLQCVGHPVQRPAPRASRLFAVWRSRRPGGPLAVDRCGPYMVPSVARLGNCRGRRRSIPGTSMSIAAAPRAALASPSPLTTMTIRRFRMQT